MKNINVYGFTIRPLPHSETSNLHYTCRGTRDWVHVVYEDGRIQCTGPSYASKQELLADTAAFCADNYGVQS